VNVRLIAVIATGALLGASQLSKAQTGSNANDPGPPSSSKPSRPPGPADTLSEGEGTPQYVPGVNRGLENSIPGEGAGTPPEQHLYKDPRDLAKDKPNPK
jgi:hypothetical protein